MKQELFSKKSRGDFVAGTLNGMLFGIIYSFFTQPFEFKNEDVVKKFKGRKLAYYRSWTWRMGLAFGLIRLSFNIIMQEEIKPIYKYSSMLLVTLGITQVLL
jgi:hypothetical protein